MIKPGPYFGPVRSSRLCLQDLKKLPFCFVEVYSATEYFSKHPSVNTHLSGISSVDEWAVRGVPGTV